MICYTITSYATLYYRPTTTTAAAAAAAATTTLNPKP